MSPACRLLPSFIAIDNLPPASSNFVIDAPFAESYMRDPQDLLVRIKLLTGVLEVGLFCSMCKSAYFGAADGTISIK